ncbi:UNVERIFIED_ORG: hypothetical protein LHK14_00545 [Roseateles sp. XES5]|nr:hypothetical protein [Roseateles sp. XES5]
MSEDSGNKNWSSGFQRLRAESVVLALILLAVTQTDVNLQKIPLVGVEIGHPVSTGVILAFLYAFYLYFQASWWFRYRIEISDLLGLRAPIDRMIGGLTALMNKVEFLRPPATAALENTVKEAIATAERGVLELSAAAASIRESANDVISTLANHAHMQQEAMDNPLVGRPSKNSLPGQDPIGRIISAFDASANAGELNRHEHKRVIGEILDQVRVEVRQLLDDLDNKGPAIERHAAQYLTQTRDLRRRLYRSDLVISVDRQILGFWLPFVFCLAVVGFTLPQGIRDMRDSASTFLACETCSLFYREPAPAD